MPPLTRAEPVASRPVPRLWADSRAWNLAAAVAFLMSSPAISPAAIFLRVSTAVLLAVATWSALPDRVMVKRPASE